MHWHRVGSVDDVPEGTNKAFDVAGQQILVAHTPIGLFAVGAVCTHQQQELEGGKMKACFLFCPLHGIRFDLRDGKPAGTLTNVPLPTWPAKIEGSDILIEIGS